MKRYSLALVLCYFAFAAIADEHPLTIQHQRLSRGSDSIRLFVKVILPVTLALQSSLALP